jgi:hypothetical protein
MRSFARSLRIVVAALATLWLCAGHPVRAGDGGEDLGSLQTYIDGVCAFLSMSTCPQIPTITQAVLEVAAMVDIAPEAVRSSTSFAVPVGPYVDAGNPSHPPGLGCSTAGCIDPLNPIAGLPIDPGVLSGLRPLAFIAAADGKGPAKPAQLYNSSANAFLYAVGGSSTANLGSPQPDTLVLFYDDLTRANDDPTRTNDNFRQGQVIAKVSLPLTVLNHDGTTERAVATTLQFRNPGTGRASCSASTLTGDFAGTGKLQTISPATLGVNCAIAFAASPVSPHPHAIFEVTVPMLITPNTDLAIFSGSPIGFGAPFLNGGGDFGFTPSSGVLGASGQSIGIGPNAAPAPSTQLTCDANGCGYPRVTPPSSGTYALCANLPREGNGNSPVPSVAAFYAIGGDGEVKLSAPLAPTIPFVCPAGM